MEPTFFETPAAFRAWLDEHAANASELLVGYYKTGSGRASLTWPESVDEALCHGWIDGIRRRIDDEAYSIRFTPRRADSNWSQRNVERVAILEAEGRMTPAGRAAYEARRLDKTGVYSFEKEAPSLTSEEEAQIKRNAAAWRDWEARPPSYRKGAIHWIRSAKREETRTRRLEQLIEASAEGTKVKPLRPPGE